ncbi:MAG TPA: hypothetical protein VHZ76_07650 [Gammaproteobacteria bacterium]|jgi:CheY-like chemotaxis protein|nr:hypothetical protein [Gammaproteobacteria bacterium]
MTTIINVNLLYVDDNGIEQLKNSELLEKLDKDALKKEQSIVKLSFHDVLERQVKLAVKQLNTAEKTQFTVTVHHAYSGENAVALIENGKEYDGILMDGEMGLMHGSEAVKRIRAHEQKQLKKTGNTHRAKILAYSMNVTRPDQAWEGTDGFLMKLTSATAMKPFLEDIVTAVATANKTATLIQKAFRGFWARKQIQQVQEKIETLKIQEGALLTK